MPPTQKKIDDVELLRMIDEEGKTQKECAQHFKVSESRVSIKLRKLKKLNEAQKPLVVSTPGEVERLKKNTQKLDLILTKVMKSVEADKPLLEQKLRTIDRGYKGITISNEIVKLWVDIMKTLTDVTSVTEFQKTIIDVVGEANASPCCQGEVICSKCNQPIDLRSLIIAKLKQAKALRSGVTFRP